MPIKNKPDFAMSYTNANEILIKSSVISTFPYSPKALVWEQVGIPCRSFEKAKKYNVDITDFGSESSIIMRYNGKSIIFFDEKKPKAHMRFSILHELGHEINGHDFTKKDFETYCKYEIEANYFAAQLLMPEQLLRTLEDRGRCINRSFLQIYFGVSAQAADKRIMTLKKLNGKWRSEIEKMYDDLIILKYADFLNAHCSMHKIYFFEDQYAR